MKRGPVLTILVLFSVLTNVPYGDSVLKQLHIIFRHGERAPTETYKTDPFINYTWSGGWGQLTNRGKLEMYSLGELIRKVYFDFVPKYYFPKDVSIMSSYAGRCLMSAQLLAAGLFPPKDDQIWNKELLWQPIPVHYKSRNEDSIIVMKAKCEKYDQAFAENLKSNQMKMIEEENSQLFAYLTEHTGQKYDSIGKVEFLYNTLEIELLNNLTLPSWTHNISFDHLKLLAAKSLQSFTETDFMKRMKGGVFLKQMIGNMEQSNYPFVYLYSGHDLSLVNILNTLGYKNTLKPGFGASLAFELHDTSEVVMWYRDDYNSDPELIVFESCSTPCYLNTYKIKLDHLLPNDWSKECNDGV